MKVRSLLFTLTAAAIHAGALFCVRVPANTPTRAFENITDIFRLTELPPPEHEAENGNEKEALDAEEQEEASPESLPLAEAEEASPSSQADEESADKKSAEELAETEKPEKPEETPLLSEEDFFPLKEVTEKPVFEERAFYDYEYPVLAVNSEIEGLVYAEIFVDERGYVWKIDILQETPAGFGFAEAVKKTFMNLKASSPAEIDGKPVPVRFRRRIVFSLR